MNHANHGGRLAGSCSLIVSNRLDGGSSFFFFNDTATTEIYTLSLHDALPICTQFGPTAKGAMLYDKIREKPKLASYPRSEEHTSELQSQSNLVCRLLLEKKTNSWLQLPSIPTARCTTRSLSPFASAPSASPPACVQ